MCYEKVDSQGSVTHHFDHGIGPGSGSGTLDSDRTRAEHLCHELPTSARLANTPLRELSVNASLVSGLSIPEGIAVSGSNLFVTNYGAGTIGEYNRRRVQP